MQKLEDLGCPKSVVGLVVPSGYSFNLDGTNIYLTMAAIFVAQALNIDLTLRQQLTILGVAMLTSKGASGVTGAGFITLAATLAVVPSIPVAGLALILGIDRFMSEARSITNFIGNGVATVVVSHWENELDRKKLGKEREHVLAWLASFAADSAISAAIHRVRGKTGGGPHVQARRHVGRSGIRGFRYGRPRAFGSSRPASRQGEIAEPGESPPDDRRAKGGYRIRRLHNHGFNEK